MSLDELVEATQVNGDLEKELDELRKRAMPLPSATHREKGSRGEIADKYVNFKRGQMISAAVDLELVSATNEIHLYSCINVSHRHTLVLTYIRTYIRTYVCKYIS